jgi:hypothetical protein
MTFDLGAAGAFLTSHGRVLDRRRLGVLTDSGSAEAVLAAVDGYRNPDGGYGWGLEPDLRDVTSQPGAALHALEAMADVAPLTTPRAVELCGWLDANSLPDGGVPFALPVKSSVACMPFWAEADPSVSSLQITAAVTLNALRVARHDPAVAGHPWLDRATEYCLKQIAEPTREWGAIELMFALLMLDRLADSRPEVSAEIERIGSVIPADGVMHVQGGLPDEVIRPLSFAPYPDRPVRSLFSPDVIAADLERLASDQREDGGWQQDFASYSPAAALEWRGYSTVLAVGILLANGVSRSG